MVKTFEDYFSALDRAFGGMMQVFSAKPSQEQPDPWEIFHEVIFGMKKKEVKKDGN